MAKLKKIKVFSFAKCQAFLLALIGLVCGIIYSLGGLIVDTLASLGIVSFASMATPGLSLGTLLAFGALLGMPIIFAIIGFFLGIIEALFYNFFTKFMSREIIDFQQII